MHREIASSAAVGKYPLGEARSVKVNAGDHSDPTFAWQRRRVPARAARSA